MKPKHTFFTNYMHAALILAILGSLMVAGAAFAAAGSLDPSFGNGGKVITDFGSDSGNQTGYAVAVQADGRIVVAGSTGYLEGDFALVRYNPNGALDASFGTGGRVTTDFDGRDDAAAAIAILSDGKLVVAGTSGNAENFGIVLARYNSDGSLDTTFGLDGKVLTTSGSTNYSGSAIAIQTDGRILVTGSAHQAGNYDFALARYNSDGSPDTTFGTDGVAATAIGSGSDFGNDLAIQPDSRIVVAGISHNGTNYQFALTRYNSNGSLDTSFDADGKVVTDFGSGFDSAIVSAIVLQPDGKIIIAGTYNDDFALARFNSDGSLDAAFDGDGKTTTNLGLWDIGSALAIQADGKIVMAGRSARSINMNLYFDFALARYNVDGSLDTSFGTGGKVTTDFGNPDEHAYAIAIQPDGRIVAAGETWNSGNGDIALARYDVSLSPPGAATLISPSGNIGSNASPDFVWNEVLGAAQYALSIKSPSGRISETWHQASAICSAGVCTVGSPVMLEAGNHTWWIRARNEAGDGPQSSRIRFNNRAIPPAAALLISPGTNDIITNHPTYIWNQVPSATSYYLLVNGPRGKKIGRWYTSAQANCEGLTCSITPSADLSAGTYTWQIQTRNSAGYGPWSSSLSFTTIVPTAAELISPEGVSSADPIYTWKQVPGATRYYLWVKGPSGMVIKQWYTSSEAQCGITTCSVKKPGTLGSGSYIWRVRTWNPVGYGPWSLDKIFTIP